MTQRRDVTINVRIPVALKDLVQKIVEQDTHLNESDFYREAIREKIRRDAPDLYRQLFQKQPEAENP